MTSEECRNIYERITNLLQRLELDWVVELSKQEVSLGKLTEQQEVYRQIPDRSTRAPVEVQQQLFVSEVPEESDSSRRRPTSLMTVGYSETEKLKILLTFVKQAVVDTTFLENEVVGYFGNDEIFSSRVSQIRFIDGADDSSPHNVGVEDLDDKKAHALRLRDLIDELLQEVENAA